MAVNRHTVQALFFVPKMNEKAIMIELYYWTTPNGHKITIFLEEAGIPYTIVPVKLSRCEQFKPDFLAISPNNCIPAIIDREPKGGGAPISVFEIRRNPALSRGEDRPLHTP